MGKQGAGMVVLAVDDERPALDDLAYLLDADEHVAQVITASSATAALRILDAEGPDRGVDAVFLDIRMPGIDGIELAKTCTGMPAAPSVVFVTAHEDKAVAAFDLGAIDYLLKPLHSARLGTTLDRIAALRSVAEPPPREEVIPVDLAGVTTEVPRSAVRFVEAHGDYVRLHTDTDSHLVRMPLSDLDERWRSAGFLRIHRSFLVARANITALCRTSAGHAVHVAIGAGTASPSEVQLPVSRRHLAGVRAELRGDWGDLS